MNGSGEQPARIGMGRRAHDIARRALLDDLARIHDRDAVADFYGDPDVVSHENDGRAELALQLAEQQQDLDRHGGIERGGRFIREQNLWLASERDHRALAHAARHFLRIGIEPPPGGGNTDDRASEAHARGPACSSCPHAASRFRRFDGRWCRRDLARVLAPGRSSTRFGRGTRPNRVGEREYAAPEHAD